MQKKSVPPELSFEALFTPGDSWEYLADAAEHPFVATPSFEPTNAWWLIELSTLSYAPEATVRETLERAGCREVEILEREGAWCVVADDLVAFRGTTDLRDLWRDLDALLVPEGAGEVHRGFQSTLDLLWEPLVERISGRGITFTGHSLGAALATIAAARHEETRAVYTFGSPRVGDKAFGESLEAPVYRVINNTDLVGELPPPLGYAHVGELFHIDADGEVRTGTDLWDRIKEGLAGHLAHLKKNLRRWRAGEFEAIPLAALVDHSPMHYAVHLWNHLVEYEQGRTHHPD
jgi:triacylglycerol lipase